ncbi:hypothetical protein [Sulfuriferula nivalis]|uniref:Transmembrane protein n=1 Tax=Sulfuriferula nivalis TaxID=2675298 RepID=A0A809RP07_9PROT|nr:hypothetical protein [Sulfuriferula nivalis]BBP00551.1 hypothetical protein SFSGTM_12590 [Sulfuriferula nivalis]
MQLTETTNAISRQLQKLQQLTWAQTVILLIAGFGFIRPNNGEMTQITLPNGIIHYPHWLLILSSFSIAGLLGLWWTFQQLDMRSFTYSRWINWHAAVFTLFILFVFILGPYQPGVVMIAAFIGVAYGTISVNVIARVSTRLQSSNNAMDVTQNTPTRQEQLVVAQQELKAIAHRTESFGIFQASKQAKRYMTYATLFTVVFPLLLSWLMPLHVLESLAMLRAYVDWMSGIVPAVAKYNAMNNHYGQLAATVNALMWSFLFIVIPALWPYILIPLWRAKKSFCLQLYANSRDAGNKEREIQAILHNRPKPKAMSRMRFNVIVLLFISWVILSDASLLPIGMPYFGPFSGNGMFAFETVNRFYMGFAVALASILEMVVYAIIPTFLIGWIICQLKSDDG